jgi:alpha-beta hydrolase superfamily lysophospholipase
MGNADINLTPTATLVDIGTIPGRSWGSVAESHAAVLMIHGLGGHSGWFEPLARRLKVRQIFALSYDQLGFGKRKEQVFSSSHEWLKDVKKVTAFLQDLVGDKPIFLIGNSMGGLIALKAVSELQSANIAGLTLLSPAFEGHPKTFPLSYKLDMLLKALFNPEGEFTLPYGVDVVAGQGAVKDWLENDPERRFQLTGRMILSLLALTQGLRFTQPNANCPVLMLSAGQDRLVDNRSNKSIFKKLISPSKKELIFSNAMHDLTLDPAVDDVANEIVNWIHQVNERRTKRAESKAADAKIISGSLHS